MEIWKEIKGYKGLYEVSNFGNVRSLSHVVKYKLNGVVGTRIQSGKILKTKRKRYYVAGLHKNHIQKSFVVHVLVAEAFLGHRPKGLIINHKDTNKHNNHVDNLEYVTCKENVRHAIKHGLHNTVGENNPNSKITEKDVIHIRNWYKPRIITHKMIADKYGIHRSYVSLIVTRKIWTHI